MLDDMVDDMASERAGTHVAYRVARLTGPTEPARATLLSSGMPNDRSSVAAGVNRAFDC